MKEPRSNILFTLKCVGASPLILQCLHLSDIYYRIFSWPPKTLSAHVRWEWNHCTGFKHTSWIGPHHSVSSKSGSKNMVQRLYYSRCILLHKRIHWFTRRTQMAFVENTQVIVQSFSCNFSVKNISVNKMKVIKRPVQRSLFVEATLSISTIFDQLG